MPRKTPKSKVEPESTRVAGVALDGQEWPYRDPVFPDDLPENWIAVILEMFAEGFAKVQVRTGLQMRNGAKPLSLKRWNWWLKKYPEFEEVIEHGVSMSESYWTNIGLRKLGDRNFNHVLWYMNMKNRFQWRDTVEQRHTVEQRQFAKQASAEEWLDKHAPAEPERTGPKYKKKFMNGTKPGPVKKLN